MKLLVSNDHHPPEFCANLNHIIAYSVKMMVIIIIIHAYTLMFVEIAVLWRTLRKNNEIKQVHVHNHEI